MFKDRRKQLIWRRLSTRSKRALTKKHKKFGHLYNYKPRGDLLANISYELNIDKSEAYETLLQMRQELLKSANN
jgi:hypothetical protein